MSLYGIIIQPKSVHIHVHVIFISTDIIILISQGEC